MDWAILKVSEVLQFVVAFVVWLSNLRHKSEILFSSADHIITFSFYISNFEVYMSLTLVLLVFNLLDGFPLFWGI